MRTTILQQKINWVEGLKVLGILAVILGHIGGVPWGGFIFSFHMPLFFMMAGFFIRFDLPLRDFFVKDFKRLMVPYFMFAFIGLAVEVLKRIALHRESLDYLQKIQDIVVWMDYASLTETYAFVLWFLPALFFAKFFLAIIDKYVTSYFLQLLLILGLFNVSFYINLPFAMDEALSVMMFVFLGNILFRFFQEDLILYFLALVLIGLYLFYGVPELDMASKKYQSLLFNVVWPLSVVCTLVLVFKKLDYMNKFLMVWGGNTMILFIVHPYTNNVAHIMVEALNFGDWYLKFFISLILLQGVLYIKSKFQSRGLFKYV